MDPAQTVTTAVIVGATGTVLGFLVHGLRNELRQDIATLRNEVRDDITTLRTELGQDRTELRREIGELRSDLTRVALAVGVRPRAERNG